MAAAKKDNKAMVHKWDISWKRLFIAGSVALNLAVLVLGVTAVTTNALDGMFMKEGLERFCDPRNDEKFSSSRAEIKALRDFACAHGEAKPYFEAGLKDYLHDYNIPHTSADAN